MFFIFVEKDIMIGWIINGLSNYWSGARILPSTKPGKFNVEYREADGGWTEKATIFGNTKHFNSRREAQNWIDENLKPR